jgi:hypothetical protein
MPVKLTNSLLTTTRHQLMNKVFVVDGTPSVVGYTVHATLSSVQSPTYE